MKYYNFNVKSEGKYLSYANIYRVNTKDNNIKYTL